MTTPAAVATTTTMPNGGSIAPSMFSYNSMVDIFKLQMISKIFGSNSDALSNIWVLLAGVLAFMVYEHHKVMYQKVHAWWYNTHKKTFKDFKYSLCVSDNADFMNAINNEIDMLHPTFGTRFSRGNLTSAITLQNSENILSTSIPTTTNYMQVFYYNTMTLQTPIAFPLKRMRLNQWIYRLDGIDEKKYLVCDTSFRDLVEYVDSLVIKHYKTSKSQLSVCSPDDAWLSANTKKTFDNVFFEQKDAVLKIIDRFKDVSWYTTRGLPHHLGILLKGDPGTGKTSFVKALAKYTSRNIKLVDMSKITTKTQFQNVIQNHSSYNIIVFEDFDRLKCIVDMMGTNGSPLPSPLLHTNDEKHTTTNVVDKNIDKNLSHSSSYSRSSVYIDSLYDVYVGATTEEAKQSALRIYKTELEKQKGEELDLPFILNVLDGIVEHRNRLLIFTCNKPEVLSNAFLRPGRIDLIIDFKKANQAIIKAILRHYYQLDDVKTLTINVSGIAEYKYTPAEIIGLCKKYDSVYTVLNLLKKGIVNDQSNVL